MLRPDLLPITNYAQIPSCRGICTRWILATLALWITVAVTMRYGCYEDRRIVLGPNTSSLIRASSFFVQEVQVRDENKIGALVYGFSDKPDLSKEINWSSSKNLSVGSYDRKGYSLWLNKGSKICISLTSQASRLDKIELSTIKGERQPGTFLSKLITVPFDPLVRKETLTSKVAEYTIEDDDKYYVSVINSSPRSIVMSFGLNVTSKLYDVTKSTNMCSTSNGSCRLELKSPDTQYVLISTSDNFDIAGRYIEVSFVARVATYIKVSGFLIVVILLALIYLAVCDDDTIVDRREKLDRLIYGTTAEEDDDAETGSSRNSSEGLYDAKLCPICRRLIHKVVHGKGANEVGFDVN